MQSCNICKKGTLIREITERAIDIKCSFCGRGWHIPRTPSHISPCMDPRNKPPIPRIISKNSDYSDRFDRDEKPDEDDDNDKNDSE